MPVEGLCIDASWTSAGILHTLLHGFPESRQFLLAATPNGVLTLWNVIGSGSQPTQLCVLGAHKWPTIAESVAMNCLPAFDTLWHGM